MIAGAATSSAAAGAMVLDVRHRLPLVLDEHGEAALLGGVLLAVAGLGILLCAYLALIWALASCFLALGPANRAGRAVLRALQVLAPQLAQRLALGAAYATAATGLVLAPAVAAEPSPEEHPAEQIPVAATLNSASPAPGAGPGAPPSGGDPVTDPPVPQPAEDGSGEQSGASGAGDVPSRPGLGWPGSVATDEPEDPDIPSDDQAPSAAGDEGQSSADAAPPTTSPSTVEVQPGDSLWSITDDLLGPGPDAPDDISSLWPVLHDVNGDVIGTDPGHIEPGQVLIVPAELSSQEHS